MNRSIKTKTLFALLGDVVVFYGSLCLVLFLRYGREFSEELLNNHILPFSFIFVLWLLVFYISGLYDARRLRNSLGFFQVLYATLIVNATVAMGFFYFVPLFGISPKTNLFLFLLVFAIAETVWRRYFNRVMTRLRPAAHIALLGNGDGAKELHDFLQEHPQFGYEVAVWIKETANVPAQLAPWKELVRNYGVNFIVVPRRIKRDPALNHIFFAMLDDKVKTLEFSEFFESVLRRVPLKELDDEWFLEHITQQSLIYNDTKRLLEMILAGVLQLILLPLELAIAIFIKLTSRGPIIYRQTRVGKYGEPFTLYKFRTMRTDAEKHGPQWAAANDGRTTLIGKILRATHLDELPQLVNILFGHLSFVGPRPERPEFVEKLRELVPYYDVRTFIKPGVTGWAQIHHPADRDIKDVEQKLEYDIYYLKNRSVLLDLVILLRTLKAFFSNP